MERDAITPISYTEYVQEGSEFTPVDREIPIAPITNQMIASMPREERLQAVKERALIYEIPFLESRFRIPLDEVRPETLDLALVLEQVTNQNFEIDYFSKLREPEKAAYEAEKAAIRAGKRGAKARNKKVAQSSEKYKARDLELESNADAARVIKETIIDGFTRATLLTPGGTDAFLLSAQDLEEQSDIGIDPAIRLLKEAQNRLKGMTDNEAIKSLAYKKAFGNLIMAEQAEPLRQVLDLAFKNNGQSMIEIQLQETANRLLEFYWANPRQIAPGTDEIPLIGLTYDLLLAANISDRREVLLKTVGFLDEKIGEDPAKFSHEFGKAPKLHFVEHFAFVETLIADKRFANFNGSLVDFLKEYVEYIQKWNPKDRGAFSVGPYTDRSLMLDSLKLLSQAYNSENINTALASGWSRTPSEQKLIDDYYDLFLIFDNTVTAAFPDCIKLNAIIAYRLNKSDYINGLRNIVRRSIPASAGRVKVLPDFLSTKGDREKFLKLALDKNRRNLDFHPEAYRDTLLTHFALQAMFYDSVEEDKPETLMNLSRENVALFSKIDNENLWFVAEQGDQFHAKKNQDLEKYDIRSITFYPSPDYSGHIIDIETTIRDPEGINVSLKVIISGAGGDLLNTQGHKIEIPDWTQLPFKNLLLRRLHYVTSGALGDRTEHPKGENEEPESQTEARRSHWRNLTSKNGRVYTLNSPEARAHAAYVKEVYGKDTYQENLKRRAIGKLAPNQVCTFVKAVVGKKEPNQLVYDEEKLRAFEATLPSAA